MNIITEALKYTFTPNELVDLAREQARELNKKSFLEDELDQIKQDFKSKLTRCEANVSDCTRRISAGYEMRSVRCLVLKFRPEHDKAIVIRTDSGEVLRVRKLSSEEKQLTLDGSDPYLFHAGLCDEDGREYIVQLTESEAKELEDVAELFALPTEPNGDAKV